MSVPPQRRYGDVALLLYGLPFIASFVYAMYLWVGVGLSATLPSAVYTEVTQSPYVFLVGFVGVLLGGLVDFNGEEPATRRAAAFALSKRLQAIAFLSVVLAAICAWYSAGFDPSSGASNLVNGRYSLIFPALLVLFSYLIVPSVKVQGANWNNVAIVLLLVASPAALYEIGKRSTVGGLGAALILILLAIYLLFRSKKQ